MSSLQDKDDQDSRHGALDLVSGHHQHSLDSLIWDFGEIISASVDDRVVFESFRLPEVLDVKRACDGQQKDQNADVDPKREHVGITEDKGPVWPCAD